MGFAKASSTRVSARTSPPSAEVMEGSGHDVSFTNFSLDVVSVDKKIKIVQFCTRAIGGPVRELHRDVKAASGCR